MLQRLDGARCGVVDDDHSKAAPGPSRVLEFTERHVEPAIAADRDNGSVGRREGSTQPAGQPIADRGEAAIRDKMPSWTLGVVEQSSPMPGEPAIGDEDRVLRQG